jgi:hypothetical protein
MEKIVFDSEWLKVKQTPKGYYFSERKGVDSIAVLLYRKINQDDHQILEVLVRMQALPIEKTQSDDDKEIPKLYRCPITGGLEEYVSVINQVRIETREEAGYDISEEGFLYMGEYYVGTQTNEKVYMYIAEIHQGTETIGIKGDGSYFESISKNEWIDIEKVLDAKYSGLFIIANKLYVSWQDGEI